MHKARENSNSSFSIGKTWNLEDLTAIESFTGGSPASTDAARRKQWAGPVGFVVTIAKPYYWQAGTAKEKEFFIGSLVKIYRKYTQGRLPQLSGFDAQEQEHMLGTSRQQAKESRQPPPAENGQLVATGDAYKRPSRPSTGSRAPSGSEEGQRYQPYHQPSSERPQRPAPLQSQQPSNASLQPRPTDSQERLLGQRPSREQMRSAASPAFSSGRRSTPDSTRSDGRQRSVSPAESSISSRAASNGPTSIPAQHSQRQLNQRQNQGNENNDGARTPNGTNLFMSAVDRFKPQGAPTGEKITTIGNQRSPVLQNVGNFSAPGRESKTNEVEEQKVPERRRPPMISGKSDGARSQVSEKSMDTFSTPMTSPLNRRDATHDKALQETKPPEESSFPGNRLRPAPLGLVGRTASEPTTQGPAAASEPITNGSVTPIADAGTQDSPSSAPDTPAPETPGDEEPYRPGLGPMIKKKARADAATFFRKAAAAHNAFKPRAGGAGNKFLPNEAKSPNEPDGISAVVPAPSLARTLASPSQTSLAERPATPKSQEEIPQVQISSPEKPTILEEDRLPMEAATPESTQNLQRPSTGGRADSSESLPPEFRRRKRRSMQHTKYLTMLNIDSTLLEGRGLDFESALGDFGWGNNLTQSQKLEAMEAEVRRELGRVEAGSWLGHLEQKDDRVETVEKMLDKAIAECEEFEGLLTLYGVELSVSGL